MSNVVRPVRRKNAKAVLSKSAIRVAAAQTRLFARSEELSQAVKELSTRFDSIENALDTMGDAEVRTRLREQIRRSREAMSNAVLELSRQIATMVRLAV